MANGIPGWAKTFRARYNWTCAHCKGLIPKGTIYHRDVMREGEPMKGPLSSRRVHLDCEAPWWQPEETKRCEGLRALPGRLPTESESPEQRGTVALVVQGASPLDGSIMIMLPNELSLRIMHAPEVAVREAAMANTQSAFELLLRAIEAAAGNRRKSTMLSNALNALQAVARLP